MTDPTPIVVQTAPVATSGNIVVQPRFGQGPAPAFQSNAFFNPGFQTAGYSQMAFQKCAFDATAFQTDPCDQPSGRSGYWRLFFHQMQEEALKEYEKKTGKTVAKPVVPAESVAEKPKTAKKPKRKPVEVELETYPEIPRLKLKPVVQQLSAYEVLSDLPETSFNETTLVQMRAQILDFSVHLENKRRKQSRRRAAAFLLLAA